MLLTLAFLSEPEGAVRLRASGKIAVIAVIG